VWWSPATGKLCDRCHALKKEHKSVDTALLRQMIRHALLAYYPKATLWPNGLGFEVRGWTFSYDEAREQWVARKTRRGKTVLGYGKTAHEAYVNAVPVKEEIKS